MAKKSKTQKAKASAARAQKKMAQETDVSAAQDNVVETKDAEDSKEKKSVLKKSDTSQGAVEKKPAKKEEKPKKKRFAFFSDVRAELKRVTWPSRQDVLRWSLVVVGALVFFGVYVALLDNLVVTPVLYTISGLAG